MQIQSRPADASGCLWMPVDGSGCQWSFHISLSYHLRSESEVVLLQVAVLIGLLSNVWALLLGAAFTGATYALLSPSQRYDQVDSKWALSGP